MSEPLDFTRATNDLRLFPDRPLWIRVVSGYDALTSLPVELNGTKVLLLIAPTWMVDHVIRWLAKEHPGRLRGMVGDS